FADGVKETDQDESSS
ncbi:hypothetical protein E2320_011938, partial [Naja naja]